MPLANDVIPFLARNANENLASQTNRPIATSSLAHPLRVRKNHASLAKTFFLGILVRSTCGKSNFINMAAVSTTAKIPSPLNLSDRLHQRESWKSFCREWKFYELAAGMHKKSQEVRVTSLLNVIDKEGMDIHNTFNGVILQTL